MDRRTIIESLMTLLCPGSDPQCGRYTQLHLLEKGSVTQALTQLESGIRVDNNDILGSHLPRLLNEIDVQTATTNS